MVFTAVLAAIAVIAAMVTVPGGKAEAAEPTDFKPNYNIGAESQKAAGDNSWGPLVWAGVPPKGVNNKHDDNDVGWAWCIDFNIGDPMLKGGSYKKSTAGSVQFDDPKYQDAAIGLAIKLRDATEAGQRDLTVKYAVYLSAILSDNTGREAAIEIIQGQGRYGDANTGDRFANFSGNPQEFTELTGLRIVKASGTKLEDQFEVDPTVEIPSQPKDAFITIVGPNGIYDVRSDGGQRVIPVDQPGLPDTPNNGGGSEEPTTSPENPDTEENTTEETTSENPGEETPSTETTTDSEPSNTDETTPKESTTEPTSPDETTKVTEPTAPVPGTEEQEKDLNPEIKTEAKIKDGNRVEKGATVIDTVTYEDLVPGKKYTLKAKLISKKDGETVLGEGSAELTPKEPTGEQQVEITVNEKADPAVDAAVAFEKLVSTEVDKDGNETSGSTDENEIATHEDINDEKQTVKTTDWNPSIHTNAKFDNAKQVKAGVTVKDTVTYTDLVPGKEYTLKAELHNKAQNDKGEHEVVGKGDVTFTPEKSAGEQVVDIKVNDDVKGVIKAAVAFEDLYSKEVDENGKETPNSDEEKKITDHRDIDDEDQTVTSEMEPSIGTKAEKAKGDEIKAGTVITDKVKYNDLVAGKKYTLNAELRSKVKDETTGDYPVIGHGEKTFVPSASKGEVEVEITVDEGVTEAVDEAVAFEYLTSTAVNKDGEDSTTGKKNDIAEHTNIEDKAQTVKSDKPSETTTPSTTTTDVVPGEPGDGGEGETSTPSSSEDSSTPKTSETCESEEPGDSESEQPSESEEPSESESSEPSESESVETESSEASETSESDEPSDCGSTTPEKPTEPSESTEPNEPGTPDTPGGDDEKDTPKISTNADFDNGSNEVIAGAKVNDTVEFHNLVPNKEYTLNAELISKVDGKSVLGSGEKTFTAETADGEVVVEITVSNDVKEPVQAAVAFEELTSTDVNDKGEDTPDATPEEPNHIAEHKQIEDKDQTVTSKPRISTNADFANGSKEVVAGATVIDTVDYFNLIPGKQYKLNAELISKEDGKTVLGKGEATVKPESANGQAEVEITASDDVKEPVEAAVAFEELTSTDVNDKGEDTPDNDKPNDIAEHKDINDKNQTVTSHKNAIVSTNADFEGDLREVVAGAEIVDQVSYEGLVPGKEYSLDAQLISKDDGKTVLGETKGHTFTPDEADGTEAVTITVNDDVTEPVEAAVAFETLTSKVVNDKGEDTPDNDKPNDIGEHKDIEDEDQTVTSEDESETSTPETTTTPKDDVPGTPDDGDKTCESEEPGDSESEQPSESEEPSESESSEPSESESVETESSEASETSESDEPSDCGSTTPEKPTEPSKSTEPNEPGTPGTPGDNNEKDTPKVSTNADFEGGLREVVAGAKVVDQVSYEGLVPGKEYTLDAQLISKEDGKTVLGETKGHKFTPESANGTEAVTIVVNDDVTEPVEAAVAFETLTSTQVDKHGEDNPTDEDNPNPVGEHKDINDDDQTVTSEDSEKTPKITTNADFEGGLREVVAGAKVVDQVSYEGLVPGKEYTLDAQLISKEDGKTVLGETKGHKFTPESANGTEAVTIVVNDDVTEPVEAAVAFETLTSTQVDKHGEDNPTDEDNPNPVGEHKDINDDDQTVTSEDSEKTPKITTNADFEKGSHAVVAGAKIVDEVSYEGLVPGKEYTLKAELINKKDGKSVLGTGEATFTPKKSKGMEPVTITVNDDVKEPVQAAVAFEELTSTEVNDKGEDTPDVTPEKPNHIAEHKDINDEDQTVISHEVHDQDTPGGSSDGSSNGSSHGSSKGKTPWWLILIPGIGLGKIIKDHHDHNDHGSHNGGHGDNTGNHDGGNGKHTDGHNGGNGHEDKGQDAPQGGNSDNGHGRSVEVQGQQPEETGNALPSNADRVEIKSVPSGATELEPGMQDYIK